MFRKYLEDDLKAWELELKEAEKNGSKEEVEEAKAKIEEIKAKDTPHELIKIENSITLNTLKKVVRSVAINLDIYAEHGQPMENLEKGFVTKMWLTMIIRRVFTPKSNGGYASSVSAAFGNRNKVRFIKTKLEELL